MRDEHYSTEDCRVSTEETTAVVEEKAEKKLNLSVEIEDVGPCRKHVRVVIPRADISTYHSSAVDEIISTEVIPGFRKGRVPKQLVEKKFKSAISDQIKQKLLIESLEQVAETHDLDPINEPDFDLETIDLPDDGDFEYEFEVEVRPNFEMPDLSTITLDRPTREITEAEVKGQLDQFLAQFGELETVEEGAAANDYVVVDASFTHNGAELREMEEESIQVKPVVRFHDAEINGFDELLAGAAAGDVRETDIIVSSEAEQVVMRGETVHAKFLVVEVKRRGKQAANRELLGRLGFDTDEELEERIRENLQRQLEYEQRQSTRAQVLEQITDSGGWDLPEQLVLRQVDNALRREKLEMQQAGYSQRDIAARESEMRQNAVSTTRQALKEHFVLDRIATEHEIEASESDVDNEIANMATQQGESPRRLRARLEKSGVIENLEAQIREMKAVEHILGQVKFNDVPAEEPEGDRVFTIQSAICGAMPTTVSGAPVAAIESDVAEESDE